LALCLAACSDDADRQQPGTQHGSKDAGTELGTAGSSGSFGKGGTSGGPSGGSGGASGGSAIGTNGAAGSGGARAASDAGVATADTDGGIDTVDTDASVIAPQLPVAANPFVLAKLDPFSTFGADVDTASYDEFSRDAALGRLPPPQQVRLEDFVNYFAYDYPAPAPDAEQPFAISLAAARGFGARETTLLRVGIQAVLPPPSAKKQANVVFLVDVSGSMSEELPMVRTLITGALDQLDPEDRVSIVTYASDTRVRLPPTAVSERTAIAREVALLQSGGGTNGASGIELAYQQAQAAFIADGINHVVLCTDGDFNIGASSDEALLELIKEKRKTGVTLTALGFGTDRVNDSMMEKVSNAGDGIFSVITTSQQAERYAKERLLSTLIHVAKDMKLQDEFNPERVRAYRLLGYEDRAIADVDFRNDVVDAGEVGAGHRVTALYELVLGDDPLPAAAQDAVQTQGELTTGTREVADSDLVLVKVRYKKPGATDSDPAFEVAQAIAPDAIAGDAALADRDMRWAAAVAAFAELLKGSAFAEPDTLDAISATVKEQSGRDEDRATFSELFSKARALLH
jgi:Ca-activated chloride channel family protein